MDSKNGAKEIPKRCKGVHHVDLGESFPNLLFEQIANSNECLLEKFGFDTAENEPYHFVSSSSREFEFEL